MTNVPSCKFNNDEVQATIVYVDKHRIQEVLQNLTSACIISQPGKYS